MTEMPAPPFQKLSAAAVATVEDISRCTYAEPEQFYSYRRATHCREPDYGRHVNAIVLAD